MKRKFNETKLAILRTLRDEPGLTCRRLAEITGISLRSVKKRMTTLMCHRKKYVRRKILLKKKMGGRREYIYFITNYGQKILQKLEDRAEDGLSLNLGRLMTPADREKIVRNLPCNRKNNSGSS